MLAYGARMVERGVKVGQRQRCPCSTTTMVAH